MTPIKTRKFKNMVGHKQGRLTVIEYAGHKRLKTKCESTWLCQCECGNKTIVLKTSLYGKTKSCGCLQKEIAKQNLGDQKGSNNRAYKHGKSSNLEFQRIRSVIKKFSITEEQYKKLQKQQNNCCAICNKAVDQFKKFLSVDHNHTTGQVRGLLCGACNIGLGMFKDDLNRLKAASNYLLNH